MMVGARSVVLILTVFAVGCGDTAPVEPKPTVMSRAAGGEAFEPTIAIDPANPDRMVVAAMYGVPMGRGAKGIWVWRSNDGGRSWTDGRLEPPRLPGDPEPTGAADVVAGYAEDGSELLTSMAQPADDPGGTFVTVRPARADSSFATGVYRNVRDSATGRTTLHDKPWMIVDHREKSPYRGTLYLTEGAIVMDPGPAGIGKGWNGPLRSRLMLAVSKDGGRTFGAPSLVADSAFGGNLAIGPAGTLEISYVRIKTKEGGADTVFHRRSSDGGVTLEPREMVAAMAGDTLLELAVLGARPNGDLLDCWNQGVRSDDRNNRVRCAVKRSGGGWVPAPGVDSLGGPGVMTAWPAVVGTERNWYLLLYLVGPARTEVALFKSPDGAGFTKVATLADAAGLGTDRFCVSASTPCRRSRTGGFVVGDYVSLAAGSGRLAAAYVFPRTRGARPDSSAVYVSTLPEPGR